MDNDISDEMVAAAEKKLRYISAAIKRNGRKILKNYPITSPQFTALQWIIEDGDLTIGALSRRTGLAFSTTTDLVDRMEKNGLVERVRDAEDRRVVRIHVLEKGRTVIEAVIRERQNYLGDMLKGFSPEQTAHLYDLLSMLHNQMDQD